MIRMLWLMSLLGFASCTQPIADEQLDRHLEDALGIPFEKKPRIIIHITEQGCPVCNRGFADMVRPFTHNPDLLVIVHASGTSIDLTGFLRETNTIRHDDTGLFRTVGLLKGSGLIVLENGRIDTIIPVRSSELEEQLIYMQTILNGLRF